MNIFVLTLSGLVASASFAAGGKAIEGKRMEIKDGKDSIERKSDRDGIIEGRKAAEKAIESTTIKPTEVRDPVLKELVESFNGDASSKQKLKEAAASLTEYKQNLVKQLQIEIKGKVEGNEQKRNALARTAARRLTLLLARSTDSVSGNATKSEERLNVANLAQGFSGNLGAIEISATNLLSILDMAANSSDIPVGSAKSMIEKATVKFVMKATGKSADEAEKLLKKLKDGNCLG